MTLTHVHFPANFVVLGVIAVAFVAYTALMQRNAAGGPGLGATNKKSMAG